MKDGWIIKIQERVFDNQIVEEVKNMLNIGQLKGKLMQFLGIGNRTCRLCGWTSLKETMFFDPEYGWFCNWEERCKWAKWESPQRKA